MAELSEKSVSELRMRQELGRECIRILRQAERNGEEGASGAKEHYEGQLKEITEELRRRTREAREAQGIEKPPTMAIGLKPGQLGARARGR